MLISLIVAMDERRGIGLNGQIPWHLPDDLKRFRQLTMGHHLIMGRKTFEAIGKPLPGRTTIVITRNETYNPNNCLVAHSFKEAVTLARDNGDDEAFVCGGGEIYAEALPSASRIYMTIVHASFVVDTQFPLYEQYSWDITHLSRHAVDERHLHPFTFFVLSREKSVFFA